MSLPPPITYPHWDGGALLARRDQVADLMDKVGPDTEMRLQSILRQQDGVVIRLVCRPGIDSLRVDEMDAVVELLGVDTE